MLPYRTLLLATGSLSTSAIHSSSFSTRMWEQSDCQAIMNKTKRLSRYKSTLPSYFREPKGSGPSQLGLHTCSNLGSIPQIERRQDLRATHFPELGVIAWMCWCFIMLLLGYLFNIVSLKFKEHNWFCK